MNTLELLSTTTGSVSSMPQPAMGLSTVNMPGGFDETLRGVGRAASDDEQTVRETATQFVASAFIMPILETMREGPFATEPFAPNSAQKRFMPLLDWQIADRITKAANFPLVDRIVEQMMQNVAPSEVKMNASSVEVDLRG